MRFISHLREKTGKIVLFWFWVFSINVFLLTYKGSLPLILYIDVTAFLGSILMSFLEYLTKKNYYKEIAQIQESLDKEFLLPEVMIKGRNQEEQQIYRIVKDMGKSMTEHVNEYKFSNREYKEFIEMWIHEVKIPIASAKLIMENHKSEIAQSINEELNKIEDYTEQALFYARSSYVEKDYFISEISLQEVVHQTLMRNKQNLIEKKVEMHLHDLDRTVLSDGKWLGFIMNQILSNCTKYSQEGHLAIEIFTKEKDGTVELHVKDDGIGICKEELPMVFEKGFTGTNGRRREKTTGIGLYLCKKLCSRLGHSICIMSEKGKGCEVILFFSKTDFYDTLS